MSGAPSWLESAIAQFGQSAGLDTLALQNGTAALRFDNGASLRLEYRDGELAMAICAPAGDPRRLLTLAHPDGHLPFRVRTGILPRTGEAVLAIRLPEREVTLVKLNAAFTLLWRLAQESGGSSWA